MLRVNLRKEIPTPRRIAVVLMLFTGVAITLSLIPFRIKSTDDLWFHLSVGRTIWETLRIPHQDFLTWAYQGKPWVAYEWLYQVMLYGLYRTGGFQALALAKGMLVIFMVCSLFYVAQKLGAGKLEFLISLSGIWCLCRGFFYERPQLFDYLFVLLFIGVLQSVLENGQLRSLLFLPVLEILWVNAHGSASFLGVALIGCAFVAACLPRQSSPSTGRFPGTRMALGAVGSLCVLMTFANPAGLSIYKNTWALMSSPGLSLFTEFKKPDLFSMKHGLVLMISGLCAILTIRRAPFLTVVTLLLMALYVQAYRNTIFLYLISIPLCGSVLTTLRKSFARKFPGVGPWPWWILAGCIFGLVLRQSRMTYFRGEGLFGAGSIRVPTPAVEFIKREGLHGRMFNPIELGGYLGWALGPSEKPMIDGRLVWFDFRLAELTAFWYKTEIWSILDRMYHFDYIVLLNDRGYRTGYFDNSPQWALVFWDDDVLIYVRNTARFKNLIRRDQFKILKPNDFTMASLDRAWQSPQYHRGVMPELERSLQESPHHCKADLMCTQWYVWQNNTPKSLEMARDVVARCPWNADGYVALSAIMQRSGRNPEALAYLEQAREIQPELPDYKERRETLEKSQF